MEDPVKPALAERSEMQQIAAAIVESVRVNVKMPLPGLKTVVIPYDAGVFFDAIEVEGFVLKLAQEICATSASRDTAIAHAEAPPPSKKTDINSATIATWRAACDAATRGNWTSDEMTDGALWVQCERNDAVSGIFEHIGSNEADASFAALARSALPAALDRVEELERLLASALKFIDDINCDGCTYEDNCPSNARHYVCGPCQASREASRIRNQLNPAKLGHGARSE